MAPDAFHHWQALRAARDIQFAPLAPYAPPPPPPPPGWLMALGRWLAHLFDPVARALGPAWPLARWLFLALGVVLILALLWHLARLMMARWSARPAPAAHWAPPKAEAHALLADADRLAGEGRYDEATHLLLRRSVDQIASARPDVLHPASTAREIARSPALSAPARGTFTTLATLVERSRYALRPLGESDWHEARTAYASFIAARITEPA